MSFVDFARIFVPLTDGQRVAWSVLADGQVEAVVGLQHRVGLGEVDHRVRRVGGVGGPGAEGHDAGRGQGDGRGHAEQRAAGEPARVRGSVHGGHVWLHFWLF